MTLCRARMTFALLFALSSGCVYVDDALLNRRVQHLDEDGDGDLHFDDCDNFDPHRHKPLDGVDNEIPYDGIDQNCDDDHLDTVDADGDGYPKLTREQWEAIIPSTEIEGSDVNYPAGMSDQVDCDDTDPSVHPGASDAAYDGVDSNCDLLNDYDRDLDGYVPDAYTAVAGANVLPGDCDDVNASVHPGAGPDDFYDGEDTDCAGNNDFDADADGWMPGGFESELLTYCAKYDLTATLPDCTAQQWGDCAEDASQLPDATLTPAEVHPGADDAPYDGVDADCDGSNEFDYDEDGFVKRGTEPRFAVFITFYGYDYPSGMNDCNDDDATVHPGVMEILGDGTDQDCDGTATSGDDTATYISGAYAWTNPRNVVVGKNDLHYLLMTGADATTATVSTQPALAMVFDPTAAFDAKPGLPPVIFNNSGAVAIAQKPMGPYVGMLTSGSEILGAIDYVDLTRTTPTAYQMTKSGVWSGTTYGTPIAGYLSYEPADLLVHLDIVVDSDQQIWTLGCGPTLFEVYREVEGTGATRTVTKLGGVEGTNSTSGINVNYLGATSCFIDAILGESTATVTTCDAAACSTWDVDTGTLPAVAGTIVASTTQPHAADAWASVNRRGSWLVGTNADGVTLTDLTTSFALLAGHHAQYADVAEDPNGTVYLAAAVDDEDGDGNDDVLLTYGDPAGTMTIEVFPFMVDGVVYSARSASVFADDTRVFLATSGTGAAGVDMVGWVFMGPPP